MSSVKFGDRVFINGGSGGVGMFAIQVAKAVGCSHITTTCSASNADFCRALGADEIIDYKSEDVLVALKNREEQFDLIYDTVFNNPELYWQSHHYLKPQGSYICVGFPPTFQFFKTLLSIKLLPRWLGGGKRTFKFQSVLANRQHFEQIAQWIREGKIKVIVEEEFALEEAGRAYARLKEGRTRGKLVVRVTRDPGGDR
jgi:NADPH:quinone reductase-like Zn-dependent oxidoreductase